MSLIRILSNQEAKKIAAGEVVERPASVVKELVENSIDAQSTKISLYIEKAGKKLIRVVDNGCGMLPEDARLCFENHATSKIVKLDDLEKIVTFGFRGEALASISSVSKIELKTRSEQNEVGVKLSFVDGAVQNEEAIASPLGTDLTVKDLFYNTPVRYKFLKQDETEWNQIQNLFQAFCLSHLSIHFQLYRNGKLVLNTPPVETIKDRVMQVWGYNMAENLLDLALCEKKGICVNGLISNHNFWRYGRQQIFFFVNGRWVKNTELSKGLMKGYRSVLPPARFPAAFLFLELDTNAVDINVHPRKEEVRFARPVSVSNTIQDLVTKTLESKINEQLAPLGGNTPEENSTFFESAGEVASVQGEPFEEKHITQAHTIEKFESDSSKVLPCSCEDHETSSFQRLEERIGQDAQKSFAQEENLDQQSIAEEERIEASVGRIIGQLLDTYIVIENGEGLLLIDQHAAHERILYEKYLKNFEQKEGTRLLFPEIVKLSPAYLKIVLQEKDFLAKQGIEVEQIGDGELAIKTSPPKVQSHSLRELIFEMIEFIGENEELEQEEFRKRLNEHMHSQLACKMAIKAGDKLTYEMMRNIVLQLQQVDNRFICVHGRPTTWSMSKAQLEKVFRRRN